MLSLPPRVSRIHRIVLWFGLLAASSTVFTKSQIASNPSQAVQLRSTDIIHRPTSRPYTGDLSVFEDLQRDKKLQVNKVMDLLGIHTGSAVADIGAGSGWFRGIIDRNGRGDDHGVNRDVVIGEVQRAGFQLAAEYNFVKPDGADYFLIFRPSPTATE